MGIFPSYAEIVEKQNNATVYPVFKEIAIDFATGNPLIKNKDFVIVEKNEAIKVWCYYALRTYKGRFLAYTNNFGSTLEDIVGKNDYEDIDIKSKIKECLLQNRYIKSIDSVNCSKEETNLKITIKITTIYGKEDAEYNV